MSDNVNAQIASGGTPVNPVAGYLNWQDLALKQQQTQAAQIANQTAGIQLQGLKIRTAPYLTGQIGQGQAGPLANAGQPAGGPPGAGFLQPNAAAENGTAPVMPVTAGPLNGQGAGAAQGGTASGQSANPILPAGATAATHSPGMPAPGQVLGALVSPYSAVQTIYGAPLPYGQAMAVAFSSDPSAALKDAMEERRSRLFELLNQPDWNQGVTQAYQEGWMDPQHYQMAINNPGIRNAVIQGLSDPKTYLELLEKYSGQGLQVNPQTGQTEANPTAIQAKGQMAYAGEAGSGQAKLQYAGPLAAAEAAAKGRYNVIDGPSVPILDDKGNVVYQPTKTTETALANRANGATGYLPPVTGAPAGSMPTLQGGPLGSGGLAPVAPSGIAPGPILGPLTNAPATPAGGYLGGQSPSLGQGAASPPGAGSLTSAGPGAGLIPSGPPQFSKPQQAAIEAGKETAVAQSKSDIEAMAKYRDNLTQSSQAAVQNNTIFDQMRTQGMGFDHGSFTEQYQGIKKYLGSISQALGGKMPESVADLEDFDKNAAQLARNTASAISPQVGVEELKLIQRNLPTSSMVSQAFNRIADQQQGLNDYALAKAAAAANFNGRPAQFESEFNKNLTPGVFILHRMPVEVAQVLMQRLKATAQGRAEWNRLLAGTKYASENGLFSAAGQ
jgi:hypothetical protein